MKNIKVLISLSIYLILVASCMSNLSSPTVDVSPSTQTSFTDTPPPIQKPNIIENCVIEYAERPKDYQLNGVVAVRSLVPRMQGLEPSLLNLRDGTITAIDLSNQSMWEAQVSPDHSTLAYVWLNNDTSQWELVLVNTANSDRKVIWTSKDEFSIFDWVNNNQILLLASSGYTIIDSNQKIEDKIIPFDFPEFDAFENPRHFFIAIDPLLSKAIYKSTDINILDLDTKTIIREIPDPYDRGIVVAWPPSGEQVAIVSGNPKNSASDEILFVDQNGQIKQLTQLMESYDAGRTIDSLSWSPDERKIAFWRHTGEGNLTLMVVDVLTGLTTNYCILSLTPGGFPVDVPAPIWLPDNIHIVVESRYAEEKSKLLVVNIAKNIAFPIAENSNPIGWMIEP